MTEQATAPTLLYSDEFSQLDLATPTNPKGMWRPNDTWQPLDKGYSDFGAGGSTFNLNPNQTLAGAKHSPFAIVDDAGASGGKALQISAVRAPSSWHGEMGANCPWAGGILISNSDQHAFGYGYYEFRMRCPNPAQGMFPALWLYAASGAYGNAQKSNKGGAEVDLLEIFGHPSGAPWSTTLHSATNNNGPSAIGDDNLANTNDDVKSWHTYAIDWTADHMDFLKDGKVIASAPNKWVQWFAGLKMDIRLNYAMDASWFNSSQKSTSSTPDGLHMLVDYVKVWSAKPAVTPTPAPVPDPTPAPTPTPAPVTNNEVVKLPLVGGKTAASDHVYDSVAALLTVRGYTTSANGTWTSQHASNVKLFQKSKGLTVDGIVGAATWARLLYA